MRTETREVNIGENTGPIDWSYPFRGHFDRYGSSDEQRDARCTRSIAWLKQIEQDFQVGRPIRVTADGGSPRCGIYPVVDVGMYDGWPFWKPTPSVQVRTHTGTDWYPFSSITNVYPGERGMEALR